MRRRWFVVAVVLILAFNVVHAVLANVGALRSPTAVAFSTLFGNLGPAVAQDTAAARNPALELLFSMFADMPGGYSVYFSGIVVQPSLTGQPLPQLGTPSLASYPVLLALQLALRSLSVLLVLVIAGTGWRLARRRR